MVLLGFLLCLLPFAASIDLDSLFAETLALMHQQGTGLTAMADRNLTQGLAIINGAIIQSSSISSNPALIAALQTASRSPAQGANEVSVPK